MTRLAIICLTWMVISAVTAYYADIWGRRLGKQRKTIGNLRPKHTAIVIITTAGALIALLSFVILLTADAGIRRALLNWDQTMAEIKMLRQQSIAQKQELDAQIEQRKTEAEALQLQVKKGQAALTAASNELQSLQKRYSGTKVELGAVQKDLKATFDRLGVTSSQLKSTNVELAVTSRDLDQKKKAAIAAAAAASRVANEANEFVRKAEQARLKTLYGEFAASSGEELGRMVIPRGISGNEARERLRRLMNGASVLIQGRSKPNSYGAGKLPLQIQPKFVADIVNGKTTQVKVSGTRLLDIISSRLSNPTAPGGTVVRLLAQANTLVGETVPVDFELFENHVVFEKGSKIVSITIKSDEGKPAVMTDLTNALRDVRAAAIKNGLMPTADNSVGSLPPYQLPDVYSEIQRAFREGQKAVTVRITAARDTWTSDELALRFEVLRYQEGA